MCMLDVLAPSQIPIVDPDTFQQPSLKNPAQGFEDRLIELMFKITALMKDLQKLSEEENRDFHRDSFKNHIGTYGTILANGLKIGHVAAGVLKIGAVLAVSATSFKDSATAVGNAFDITGKAFEAGSSIHTDHNTSWRETHRSESELAKADSDRASNNNSKFDQDLRDVLAAYKKICDEKNNTLGSMT